MFINVTPQLKVLILSKAHFTSMFVQYLCVATEYTICRSLCLIFAVGKLPLIHDAATAGFLHCCC